VQSSPMRVALVYNQKKEGATQQSEPGDAADPPSLDNSDSHVLTLQATPHLSTQHVTDLYAEWDTQETITAMKSALSELHDVTLIEADEFAFERLRIERPEIVFNITEGLNGVSREAQIPAMLEMLQIPYTGSDPLTLALCLDKSRAKEILTYYHIPTPKFTVVSQLSDLNNVTAHFPMMVKPLHEGSSKGIFNSSLVNSIAELTREVTKVIEQYNEPALVEEYLCGREFTVAMLGNGEDLTVLPIVEIKFDSLPSGVNPIYSYEAKWIWDRSDAPLDIFECPARIPSTLRNEIETICRKAFTVLRCRDWCRIDVRLDNQGQPHILELNPLPGILPNPEDNSCFPKAARAAGMNYNQLLQTVLAVAAKRYGRVNNESSLQSIM
jgi:D-alanine-D-alanine ligase